MGYGFRYDSTGTKCSGGPRPGAIVVGKWSKAHWGLPLIGIYNCRPSRSGTSLSTHGEGRGIDAHVHTRASEAPPTPAEKAVGDAIWAFYIAHAETVGVQAVIWLDQRWDARTRQVKHYSGPFHGNHVHIELCRPAAEALTPAVLDGLDEEDDMAASGEEILSILKGPYTEALTEIRVNLRKILGTDFIDEGAITAEVLSGLNPEAIAAAIPAGLAKQVADELAKRLRD